MYSRTKLIYLVRFHFPSKLNIEFEGIYFSIVYKRPVSSFHAVVGNTDNQYENIDFHYFILRIR